MSQTSCLFWYKRKAVIEENGTRVPLKNADGSIRYNDNYLNFLQVISTYWEPVQMEDGSYRNQLNVFMTGGSIVMDKKTGQRISRNGYTLQFPEATGNQLMKQFYEWSCAFGLSALAPVPVAPSTNEAPRRGPRPIDEDDFLAPDPNGNEIVVEE